MFVEYSGWSKDLGPFHCKIFVDENKTDYEIHFSNGAIAKQNTPFSEYTEDWNHDDDTYTLFGAWFNRLDKDGKFDGGEFWTPVDMVSSVADTVNPDFRPYGVHVVRIPGITVPPPEKRTSLEDQILASERRLEAQEVERNRKMDALGIRHLNEPWVR